MSIPTDIARELRENLVLYREILSLIEREGQHLRRTEDAHSFELVQSKRAILPRLNQSLDKLKEHRVRWQKMMPGERARNPEIVALLRQNQDLIMKIILMDRENEQILLRRGLIPAKQLASVSRPRPHFVAQLYRRSVPN